MLSDIALGSLGGDLKRREKLTGHLADVLTWIYLGTCVLKRFEAEGRQASDLPMVRWSMEHCLSKVEDGFANALRNFPVPVLGSVLALHARTWGRINPIGLPPSDAAGAAIARVLLQPGALRERLVAGTHRPMELSHPLARLERAFELNSRSGPIVERVRAAGRRGEIPRGDAVELAGLAVEKAVITEDEASLLREADSARRDVIQVDSFAPGVIAGSLRVPS